MSKSGKKPGHTSEHKSGKKSGESRKKIEATEATEAVAISPVLAPRTADEIGRTTVGPRPVPGLAAARVVKNPVLARAELPSGLTVIAVRKPGVPLVEVRLRVPFGGRNAIHAARAELLAATLLFGTGRRDRQQVDADLATVGGHLAARVDPQRLMISGSVLSQGLPLLLEVLADSLTDPAFVRQDVLGERDRIVEQLALAASEPAVVAQQKLQLVRFGAHPASMDHPDADLVAAAGPAAVRALHRRAVLPAGSVLVLVGDLRPADAIRRVTDAIGGWDTPGTARPLDTPPAVVGGPLTAFHRDAAVQSQVRLTAAAVDRSHPHYPASQLANLVFGGYFSSRLMENIREDKGYTYGAHSGLEFWPGRAAVTVSFDTATSSTAAALLETRYELGRLALTPPSETEVESARQYALGTLATSLSTQAGYASTLSSLLGLGLDVDWLQAHPARLSAVTPAEVAGVAATIFAPSAFTGVVLGNLDQIGTGLTALGGVTLP